MKRQALVEPSSFQAIEGDIWVVPHTNRIFWSRLKSEFVVTVRMLVLTIEEEVILQREISFHLIQTERTIAILHLCGGTVWSFGLHIDGGYRFHIGQRILAQIDLSILYIGDADTVKIHSDMLRAERTHVDCFQASQSTIILYLYARKVLQGISHGCRGKVLQSAPRYCLTWCKIMRFLTDTHDIIQWERVTMQSFLLMRTVTIYALRITRGHTHTQQC